MLGEIKSFVSKSIQPETRNAFFLILYKKILAARAITPQIYFKDFPSKKAEVEEKMEFKKQDEMSFRSIHLALNQGNHERLQTFEPLFSFLLF